MSYSFTTARNVSHVIPLYDDYSSYSNLRMIVTNGPTETGLQLVSGGVKVNIGGKEYQSSYAIYGDKNGKVKLIEYGDIDVLDPPPTTIVIGDGGLDEAAVRSIVTSMLPNRIYPGSQH